MPTAVLERDMTRRRVCRQRCQNAKGKRCRCVCQGATHGKVETKRMGQKIAYQYTDQDGKLRTIKQIEDMTESEKEGIRLDAIEKAKKRLAETAYIEQKELPLEDKNHGK